MDQSLELVAEFLDARDHRRRARVTENADRRTGHVVRYAHERVEIFHRSLTVTDALQNFRRPRGSFATLCALRAALVSEESCESCNPADHRLCVVDYDHAA